MADVKKRLAEGWIRCNAVIELIGKPKEHIESTMKDYVAKIKQDKHTEIIEEKIADVTLLETGAQDDQMVKEMWSTFAELDILFKGPMALTYFCFDYMPSSIEIVEPSTLIYTHDNMTEFFNDLQARLHQVDLLAKQQRNHIQFLRKGIHDLLQNYVKVLLHNQKLTSAQLSHFTGVGKELIEDLMDMLVDEGKITMEGEKYLLVKNEK